MAKNILFLDFNGVLSQKTFWFSLSRPSHPSHRFFAPLQTYLFGENIDIVKKWMKGGYTSEQVVKMVADAIDAPYAQLLRQFITDAVNLDVSVSILKNILILKKEYIIVLMTDNMDSFSRFTLPAHAQISETFDEIFVSCEQKVFKTEENCAAFESIIAKYGAVKENCILLDDSVRNCAAFEVFGGQAVIVKGVAQTNKQLKKIIKNTEQKWQWQI